MSISSINSETKILACIHIQLEPSGYSVISASHNDTLLIEVIDGSCVLDGFGTTSDRNRMVIYRSQLETPRLPVNILDILVIIQRLGIESVGVRLEIHFRSPHRVKFHLKLDKFIRIHKFHLVRRELEAGLTIIRDFRLSLLSAFCCHKNDSIGSSGSIDCRRRRILEHINGFYIRRIQRRCIETVHWKTIDYIKRRVILSQ